MVCEYRLTIMSADKHKPINHGGNVTFVKKPVLTGEWLAANIPVKPVPSSVNDMAEDQTTAENLIRLIVSLFTSAVSKKVQG